MAYKYGQRLKSWRKVWAVRGSIGLLAVILTMVSTSYAMSNGTIDNLGGSQPASGHAILSEGDTANSSNDQDKPQKEPTHHNNTPVTPVVSALLSKTLPWHTNITATLFWVGEDATLDNSYMHNRSSAWITDWVSAYGGIDDSNNRCGIYPCGFIPKENPFYFALPFGDFNEQGLKTNLTIIPWYNKELAQKGTLLKNSWIAVKHGDKVAYAQWEDVGPYEKDDYEYVFGMQAPKNKQAGLDLSPAAAQFLGVDGKADVDWKFVASRDVPEGPWKSKTAEGKLLVTTSVPSW